MDQDANPHQAEQAESSASQGEVLVDGDAMDLCSHTLSARQSGSTAQLRAAGLRPTRQRVALASILFDGKGRHVSAEWLYDIAKQNGVDVSLATVYNTLHQFTGAGLLREVTVDSSRTYFDTNMTDHHHMYLEHEDRVIDVPSNAVSVNRLPDLPDDLELVSVDVLMRVRPKDA